MTATDFYYYLLLGMMLGLYSIVQGLLRTLRKPAAPEATGRAAEPLSEPLQRICRLERADDLDILLKALLARYGDIVGGFLDGDIGRFAGLMSPEVEAALQQAIADRAASGEPGVRLVGAQSAKIVDAAVEDGTATLRIAFVGLLAARTGAADPHPADLLEATEVWTFERSTDRHRPEWRLVGTEPVG